MWWPPRGIGVGRSIHRSGIRQSPKNPGDASETGRIPATQTATRLLLEQKTRRYSISA